MALDTTIGGADSNSYVTLVEADAYFENHWLTSRTTTWNALSDEQKESALKVACQIISSLRLLDDDFSSGRLPLALYEGENYDVLIHRAESNQRLPIPRNIDLDSDNELFIPQDFKDAQCEQAVFMLTVDEGQLATQLSGVVEEASGVGGVRNYQQFGSMGSLLAPMAITLLRRYLRKSSSRIRRA